MLRVAAVTIIYWSGIDLFFAVANNPWESLLAPAFLLRDALRCFAVISWNFRSYCRSTALIPVNQWTELSLWTQHFLNFKLIGIKFNSKLSKCCVHSDSSAHCLTSMCAVGRKHCEHTFKLRFISKVQYHIYICQIPIVEKVKHPSKSMFELT